MVFSVVPPASGANQLRLLVETELWVMRPMYEYLIGVDPANGKLIPQLATGWALEPAGRSFRFTLKEGVQFHGGFGEMTAEDVRHSLKDVVQEDTVPQYATYYRRLVEDVELPASTRWCSVTARMTATSCRPVPSRSRAWRSAARPALSAAVYPPCSRHRWWAPVPISSPNGNRAGSCGSSAPTSSIGAQRPTSPSSSPLATGRFDPVGGVADG